MKVVTLFANDPGSVNYGYAIVQVAKEGSSFRTRIVRNGLCFSTVKNLKNQAIFSQECTNYTQFAQQISSEYSIDLVCAERYMTRGVKGPLVEAVNIMLGGLRMAVFPNTPFKIMPAATWKNAVTRAGIDLKQTYRLVRTTPHQLDACLIGIYSGMQSFGVKDFDGLRLKKIWRTLLDQVEDTSVEALINRKMRR